MIYGMWKENTDTSISVGFYPKHTKEIKPHSNFIHAFLVGPGFIRTGIDKFPAKTENGVPSGESLVRVSPWIPLVFSFLCVC